MRPFTGGVVSAVTIAVLVSLAARSGFASDQTYIGTTPTRVPAPLIRLSERSAVHLLIHEKGSPANAGWRGVCTASKISATELISARHCFEVQSFPPVPSGSYAENVVGLGPFEFAVADPTDIARPLLPVTGISVDDDNDVALIAVEPSAASISPAARRVWQRVSVLSLPLADRPPPADMPVVVTSFPAFGLYGRFAKITWTGHFANRRSGGLVTPKSRSADEDNVIYGKSGADACKPGASGSRLIFANGTVGGTMWTYTPASAVPTGVIPAGVIAKNKSDFAGVCSFSVLTDKVLSGLRRGLGPAPPPAAARAIRWHMLQGDETPFGFNQVAPDVPQFGGDFTGYDTSKPIGATSSHSWSWDPQQWNVSVISSAAQLAEVIPFTRGALSQALENVRQFPEVDFIKQSLLLVQVTTLGPCCDIGVGRITARGDVVTITVRPKVLRGCLDPPSGLATCNGTSAAVNLGLGFFRLVRIPAGALPKGVRFWALASNESLPSDYPVRPTQADGAPRLVPFTSLGSQEDGGGAGVVPLLTSSLPEFVSQPDQIDNEPPWRNWDAKQARVTVFSTARQVFRLVGSLGKFSTVQSVADAATTVDFSKQRLILIQISTADGCCLFAASTLTIAGTAARVELHPIVPTCSNPGGLPCAVAVFQAPDVYNELITVDRNAFPVPTTFSVATSQIPAANSP